MTTTSFQTGDAVQWTQSSTRGAVFSASRRDGTVISIEGTIAKVRTSGGRVMPLPVRCLRLAAQKSQVSELVELIVGAHRESADKEVRDKS